MQAKPRLNLRSEVVPDIIGRFIIHLGIFRWHGEHK